MSNSDPIPQAQRLAWYEQGAFLSLWDSWKEAGPPESWTDPDQRILAGRAIRFLGDTARGERLILRTWRRHPTHPEAHHHMLWIRAGSRGPWAALAYLQKTRGHVSGSGIPGDTAALEGSLYSHLRDFSRAEERLQQARHEAPLDPWIEVCWAGHYERLDRTSAALERVDQALTLNPRYPHALTLKAHLLQHIGREEEALALLERTSWELEDSQLALQLARLYDELGRPDDLDRALDRHEALTPLASPELRELRAQLRAEAAYYRGDLTRAADWARQAAGSPFFDRMSQRWSAPEPHWRRVALPVPFVRQKHLTCVPATLTSLAQYWNRPVDQLEVAEAICYDGTASHSERRWATDQGWITREFRVTAAAARQLLDRGLPFALCTVFPGNAHEQAVFGYDDFRDTLLIRDPSQRSRTELVIHTGLPALAANGPRGLLLLPPDRAADLDGIDLPEAEAYDHLHALYLALDRHDRLAAAAAAERLIAWNPLHRLTWQARRALAGYDGNAAAHLAAVEALLSQFPEETNWQLARNSLLRELAPTTERLARLRADCNRPQAHPLLWQELASELAVDARELGPARQQLDRAARRRPLDGYAMFLRAQLAWEEGLRPEALDLYRLASCLDDKRSDFARAYFRQSRWVGRTEEALGWLKLRFERDGRRSGLPGQVLSWAYSELDQVTQASTVLEQAVELRPTDMELRLYAVEWFARLGDLPRAEAHLAAARSPAAPGTWGRAAAALANRRGEAAEELRLWGTVLETEPTAVDAHRRRTELLAETQGPDAALTHLTETARRFPYSLNLRRLLIDRLREEQPESWESAVRDYLEVNPICAWGWRELALALIQSKRSAEAQAALNTALPLEPRAGAWFNLQGELHFTEGRWPEARACFAESLVLSVDDTWAMRRLLAATTNAQERQSALDLLQQELSRQTTLGHGWFEFADLARPYLTPDQLLAPLQQAHQHRPDLWQTWSTMARQLSAIGRPAEALATIEQALERFPFHARLWADQALIHLHQGDARREQEAWNRVRELSPEWGWALRYLAQNAYRRGVPTEARQVLEEAVRRSPRDSSNWSDLAEARRKSGDLPGAIEALRTALRIEPGNVEAWNLLQTLGAQAGQPNLAAEQAAELTHQRPGEARSWWLHAEMLSGPDRVEQRLELLNRALQLSPKMIAAHRLRANLLAEAGHWDEACAACQPEALAGHPSAELLLTEAELWWTRGNPTKAIASLRQALAVDPGLDQAWQRLSQWQILLGEFRDAQATIERWIEVAPLNAAPFGLLGELHARDQNLPKATEAFRRAFDLDPQYRFAGRKLFDVLCRQRQYNDAATVAERLRTHLPEAEGLLLDLTLVLADSTRGSLPDLLRRLCRTREDHPAIFAELADQLKDSPHRKTAASVLAELVREPQINPATGSLWVTVAFAKQARALRKTLIELGFTSDLAIRAWDTWLDAAGDYFSTAKYQSDLLRRFRDLGFRSLYRRHGAELRAPTRLWGQLGRIFCELGKWSKTVELMQDWRDRPDAQPWMLSNLAWARCHLGPTTELRELLQVVVRMGNHDTRWRRYELWEALLALAEDQEEPARKVMAVIDPQSLDRFEKTIWSALQAWQRFPTGTRQQAVAAADRAAWSQFFESHARVPELLAVGHRLMGRVHLRGDCFWLPGWSSSQPGGQVRRIGKVAIPLTLIVLLLATKGGSGVLLISYLIYRLRSR